MSFTKKMLAFAAVSALTAATAVPAMALENEFHGLFRFRGIVSNFDDSVAGAVTLKNPLGARNPTFTYMEQRARLMYIAKANDDLKLVTHFEFDSRFGDTSYNANATNTANSSVSSNQNASTTRNGGGGVGADQTNLETKNIYLDFKIPSTPVQMKVGIQGYTDNYKGIIFNNDAAGVTATAKTGNLTIMGSYFRFDDATTGGAKDNAGVVTAATNQYLGVTPVVANGANLYTSALVQNTAQVGNTTRDFMTVGAKLAVTKDLTVGADYFLLYSDVLRRTQEETKIHMVGLNGEAKIGPATISGFALYQNGQLGTGTLSTAQGHQNVSAFAGNLAAKMAVGPGTAKFTSLYVSGDTSPGGNGTRNDFQTIMERSSTSSGHTFFEANSQLLLRNAAVIASTDRAVVFDLNNNARGLIAAFVGYDLAIKKFYMNSNIGIGAVAKDNANFNTGGSSANTAAQNAAIAGSGPSNILGTEVNTEIGYKLYDNMTASVCLAYLFLGDFYKNTANRNMPENPYSTKVMLNYTF